MNSNERIRRTLENMLQDVIAEKRLIAVLISRIEYLLRDIALTCHEPWDEHAVLREANLHQTIVYLVQHMNDITEKVEFYHTVMRQIAQNRANFS
eukprot:snap_masked-scaffold_18-processed-gene-6.42-mRNA-1 protein AED:1.00 eAED:1.00 QI:0/-1/0/0/-1/1/1/0/94